MYWVAHESLSKVEKVYTTVTEIRLRWYLKKAFKKRYLKKKWEPTGTDFDATRLVFVTFFLSNASIFRYEDSFLMA